MPLAPGTRLGPYEILAPIGAGGMGEVYKARDTRLGRAVAVKILSEQFSGRFEREARAISSLNHPHICTLYDVGPNYLVMELVEGETLAAKLKNGALPMEQVLQYGAQIAAALAEAHAHGIIHRDLKPANVMITKSGVKVLDFGLAKTHHDETITATQAVIGTPAYMAPEQRAGEECDARTDIYGLGLVLYEMATGKRPPRDPSLSTEGLSPQLAHVVKGCLAPHPEDRWQSAGDLRRVLEWFAETREQPAIMHGTNRRLPLYGAAFAALIALCVLVVVLRKTIFPPASTGSPVVRLAIPMPVDDPLENSPPPLSSPAISPDGKMLAVTAGSGPNQYLWLRRLDSDKFERLAGTQGAIEPFWSPDGRQIGFFAGGKLKKTLTTGGDPQDLCRVPSGAERQATWSISGTILYGVNYVGLFRVSERGGQPAQVAGLDQNLGENSLRSPVFLPDGERFIYFSRTRDQENRGVYLDTLNGKKRRKKLAVTDAEIWLGRDPVTGRNYLLFSRNQKLWAQFLNIKREELEGDPIAIAEAAGQFSASTTGTLVFQRVRSEEVQFIWMDRSGRELGTLGSPVPSIYGIQLSPDDRYATFINHRSLDGHFSIWLIDIARNLLTPFSVQTVRSFSPVWSFDSKRVYFDSKREGRNQIFAKAVDDAGPEHSQVSLPGVYRLLEQSPDGQFWLAVLRSDEPGTKRTLVYASAGQNDWRTLLGTSALEDHGQFSPDGRWVAYDSNESGAQEVYVTDFPGAQHKQRISVEGGTEPRWRRDGKELLYYSPTGALMSLDISKGPDFTAARPVLLFAIRFTVDIDGYHYALSRDGQRILAAKETGQQRSRDLNVVFNWPQLLRKEPEH